MVCNSERGLYLCNKVDAYLLTSMTNNEEPEDPTHVPLKAADLHVATCTWSHK